MVHITSYSSGSDDNGMHRFSLQGSYDRKKTQQELLQVEVLPPQFVVEFAQNSLVYRVCALAAKVYRGFVLTAKVIGYFLYLPYSAVCFFSRFMVLPSRLEDREQLALPRLEMMNMGPNKNWVVKRTAINLKVEGVTIDVCLMGRQEHLQNGKWLLAAMPNGVAYEMISEGGGLEQDLANELDANIICFNYPGIGASVGSSNSEIMAKAYKAVLLFLEKEIKATKIIHYGRSMGGGVQALGLDGWDLNSGIQHVCIKDRSFCSNSEVAGGMFGAIAKIAVQFFGWEIDVMKASIRLSCPEIIIQTGTANFSQPCDKGSRCGKCVKMEDKTIILDDGFLPASSTLAEGLRQHYKDNPQDASVDRKHFFVTASLHNALIDVGPIANKVREILGEQKSQRIAAPASLWQRVKALPARLRGYLPKSPFAA